MHFLIPLAVFIVSGLVGLLQTPDVAYPGIVGSLQIAGTLWAFDKGLGPHLSSTKSIDSVAVNSNKPLSRKSSEGKTKHDERVYQRSGSSRPVPRRGFMPRLWPQHVDPYSEPHDLPMMPVLDKILGPAWKAIPKLKFIETAAEYFFEVREDLGDLWWLFRPYWLILLGIAGSVACNFYLPVIFASYALWPTRRTLSYVQVATERCSQDVEALKSGLRAIADENGWRWPEAFDIIASPILQPSPRRRGSPDPKPADKKAPMPPQGTSRGSFSGAWQYLKALVTKGKPNKTAATQSSNQKETRGRSSNSRRADRSSHQPSNSRPGPDTRNALGSSSRGSEAPGKSSTQAPVPTAAPSSSHKSSSSRTPSSGAHSSSRGSDVGGNGPAQAPATTTASSLSNQSNSSRPVSDTRSALRSSSRGSEVPGDRPTQAQALTTAPSSSYQSSNSRSSGARDSVKEFEVRIYESDQKIDPNSASNLSQQSNSSRPASDVRGALRSSSGAPEVTGRRPTQAPVTKTASVHSTQNAAVPGNNPAAPVDKTVQPANHPVQPVTKPPQPVKPAQNTMPPLSLNKAAQPETKPFAPINQSIPPVDKNALPTSKPAPPTVKADTSVKQLAQSMMNPPPSMDKAVPPSSKPAPPTKPIALGSKPLLPASKVVQPTSKPPSTSTSKLAQPSSKDTRPPVKPSISTTKPIAGRPSENPNGVPSSRTSSKPAPTTISSAALRGKPSSSSVGSASRMPNHSVQPSSKPSSSGSSARPSMR